MVNIIENWSGIEGTVISMDENDELPNYYVVEVQLQTSSDVVPFPNLARADVGKHIHINIKKNELEKYNIKLGANIICTVRKSLKQAYFMK
jgi:hypothetical protein